MPVIFRAADTRPLRVAPFRRLWLSSVVTAIGGQFAVIAVPKQLYDLTGNSALIGVAGIVTFACLGVSALWGGALADVKDRRSILLVTNSGIALTALLFWALYDVASPPVLLALVGLQAACVGANMSVLGAAIPRLVPVGLLAAANSLTSLVRYLGPIVGPLLAGLLMPLIGLKWLYFVDAVALSVTVWAVWRLPPIPPGEQAARRTDLRHIMDGFRYLASHKVLLAVLAADLSAMVFGLPVALYPEIAERTFGDPAGGGFALGLLYAAYPAGVLAMGLISGTFTHISRHGLMVTIAVTLWGLTVIGFGLSQVLWLAVAFLAAGGAVNFLLSTFRNAITQAYATDEMRGRTQGSLTLVLMGGPSLANVLHGTVGAATTPAVAIVGGGVLTVLAMLAIATAVPAFFRYRPGLSER
jgi:MFS family permease